MPLKLPEKVKEKSDKVSEELGYKNGMKPVGDAKVKVKVKIKGSPEQVKAAMKTMHVNRAVVKKESKDG